MQVTKNEGQNGLPMKNIERILVNLPTREWLGVIEYAIFLARKFGARLYVVDVIHDPFGSAGWNLPMPSLEKEFQQIVAEARDRLQAIMEKERAKGFVIEPLVREGDPAEQLTKVIEEKEIDVLVLPAHEEDRIEDFLFGGVYRKLIREMPCSILLVQPAALRHPLKG
ncbi:MAG: universal stress protein [Syntrophorhabdales bacterium]